MIQWFPLILSLLASPWIISVQAADRDIKLQTIPELDRVGPGSEAVKIALVVSQSDQRQMAQDRIKIRFYAPAKGWLFSTDFPRVEGSLLAGMEMPVSDGRVEWEYVFPIRGIYRLEARLASEGGKEIQRTFELKIRERPRKFMYLALLVIVLFLFGFMAGRLLTHVGGEGRTG